jgi:putative transposase
MKRSYHSDVIISFQLGVLQPEILQQVPSSTLHNWKHRDLAKLVGTKQCLFNEQHIRMVKDFLKHKQAMKFAKAAYLAFNVLKTFTQTSNAFRKWARNNKKIFVEKIQHLVLYFPLSKSLKLFDVSSQAYHRWKNQINCDNSLMRLCHKTHPFQLCPGEVANIKKYLSDKSLLHWPLASIYYRMLRQSAGYMSLATFYKYSRCMLEKGMVPLGAPRAYGLGSAQWKNTR